MTMKKMPGNTESSINKESSLTAQYIDACSKCKQPCTRVKVQILQSGYPKIRYLTNCCNAAPMAINPESTNTGGA